MGKVDLGQKLTCSSCEARFYDLNKTPAICPKCGAENRRPKPPKAKKAETAPKPEKVAAKPKQEAEDDDAEDLEDDDEDDLINDDEDLDDEDDDVVGVIVPIGKDDDSDI